MQTNKQELKLIIEKIEQRNQEILLSQLPTPEEIIMEIENAR